MSRRSRRRKATGERRWVGKLAVGLLVFGVIALAVTYTAVRGYLHSDGFRRFLSAEVSKATGVDGEFERFHWDGLAVDTDSFQATGNGFVTGLKADGLHTEIGLGGFRRGVWEIRGSSVRRLEVTVDTTKGEGGSGISSSNWISNGKVKSSSWLPREAELEEIDVRSVFAKVILAQGTAVAKGMIVHAEQDGAKGAYRGEIEGGSIKLPFAFIPEVRLDRVLLRYQNQHVYLTKATFDVWRDAHIDATGECDVKSQYLSLEGTATGIQCGDLLSEDWSKRLTGDASSSFSLESSSGSASASGELTLKNGVLTALPLLDVLAAYADTRRFRVLTLSEAHTRWQWKKGEFALSNLVISSEGLVRLEGSLIIRGKELDGLFRLGLAPGTLATIPGAETDVFLPGERGLLWTPLRISGTFDDPKEDLTDRLIAAAGLRMFDLIPETGEKVIKFTQSVIGGQPTQTLQKGVEILDKGGNAVNRVTGILDDILGTELIPEEKKEP